jgi:hypothetical protein
MWLPIVGKTSKGKKPQGRKLLVGCFLNEDNFWQRRQSGQTLERSERLREEALVKSNSKEQLTGRKPQRSTLVVKIKEGAKNR